MYNDLFDHMDYGMHALPKHKIPSKENLFLAVKLARQKLSKSYAEVTPSTDMLLISAHILDPFWKMRSLRKWDKGMYIDPAHEISYTTRYQDAVVKYVEDKYCRKHQHVLVNKHESLPMTNFIPSGTVLGSCQSSFYQYDLCSDDEE